MRFDGLSIYDAFPVLSAIGWEVVESAKWVFGKSEEVQCLSR